METDQLTMIEPSLEAHATAWAIRDKSDPQSMALDGEVIAREGVSTVSSHQAACGISFSDFHEILVTV